MEFDWTGTYDPTSYLCIPEAIEFMKGLLPGGLPALQTHNHNLVLAARNSICQRFQIPLPCPDSLIGSMVAFPLPQDWPESLQTRLFDEFSIEVPVTFWPASPTQLRLTQHQHSMRLLRLSAQIYNTARDYDQLQQALSVIMSAK
jgi:isopenicillin-N epimerase